MKRKVVLTIPEHPWEIISGKRLWYTLRWTDGDSLETLHLSQDERSVTLEIVPGRTVFALAYPLGDMGPFAAIIGPQSRGREFLMNQEDGFLASMMIDLDLDVLGMLNYSTIYEQAHKKTSDVRELEDVALLRDIQNGELSDSSFKVCGSHVVGPFAVSNGIWESEFLRDPGIVADEGIGGPLTLPAGVFRFLNVESDMILVLIVDRDGNLYSYLKHANL